MKDKIYDFLWFIGQQSGCHQMAQRSFFFGKYQCPVCARCFGAFIGYVAGFFVFPFYELPLAVSILFCVIMFADWLVQRLDIKPSTNIRRFITGLLCGFGLMQIFLLAVKFIVLLFS